MSVVEKRSGAVRICIDPRPLNLALKREHFKLPSWMISCPGWETRQDSQYVTCSKDISIANSMMSQACWQRLPHHLVVIAGSVFHLDWRLAAKSSRNAYNKHRKGLTTCTVSLMTLSSTVLMKLIFMRNYRNWSSVVTNMGSVWCSGDNISWTRSHRWWSQTWSV